MSKNTLVALEKDERGCAGLRLDPESSEGESSQECMHHYQDTESVDFDSEEERVGNSQHGDSEVSVSDNDDDDCDEKGEVYNDPCARDSHASEGSYTAELHAVLLCDREGSHTYGTSGFTQPPSSKLTECCLCGAYAIYTCPSCGRRTCSMTCVRVHKKDFQCTGARDVTAKVPLSEFTDKQLQRDYHFLENCRRVIGNVVRSFPRTSWRYNFKALPPPLHALREAARRRGVICQITSEGMHKREENTSRLDRKTNTIVWRCEFEFHHAHEGAAVTTISTDWGSERHRLGDVLKYCWATNPPLLCYHINRQYNRASKYVGSSMAKATKGLEEVNADMLHAAQQDDLLAPQQPEANQTFVAATAPDVSMLSMEGVVHAARDAAEGYEGHSPVAMGETQDTGNTEECPSGYQVELPPLRAYEEVPPVAPIVPTTPQEAQIQTFVEAFLAQEKYFILSKAERLGIDARYFLLDPYDTLNENLRRIFFVNEFPVFVVVHASQLHRFTLVTEEDKEAIRSSFRSRRTQEVRERPPLRKRCDMEPEELERLSRVPCRRFLQSRCLLADECPYWHCTPEEIPVCRSFLRTGQCEKGTRCSFRHDADAVRIARKRQRDGLSEHGNLTRAGVVGRSFGSSRRYGDGRRRGVVGGNVRSRAYTPHSRTG